MRQNRRQNSEELSEEEWLRWNQFVNGDDLSTTTRKCCVRRFERICFRGGGNSPHQRRRWRLLRPAPIPLAAKVVIGIGAGMFAGSVASDVISDVCDGVGDIVSGIVDGIGDFFGSLFL